MEMESIDLGKHICKGLGEGEKKKKERTGWKIGRKAE